MTKPMIETLVTANAAFIRQGLTMLDGLTPAQYRGQSPAGLASAGAHLRHVLDHYLTFLDGVETGRVDYDARPRDGTVETEPDRARTVGRETIERLEALGRATPDRALEVRMDCGGGTSPLWVGSSVGRELQFLVSHTVHHYALIKSGLADAGVELPEEFGVAPSTLAFRSGACAR